MLGHAVAWGWRFLFLVPGGLLLADTFVWYRPVTPTEVKEPRPRKGGSYLALRRFPCLLCLCEDLTGFVGKVRTVEAPVACQQGRGLLRLPPCPL